MQTVLITGANGFVSWYLIRDLLKGDYKIIATGKGSSRLTFSQKNLIYEALDFTDSHAVKTVFEKHKPDVVVHAGAMSKPDECEQHHEAAFSTNVQGTENLLAAASFYKSYFLFLSTDFVFEGKSLQYQEDAVLAPVNYYGQTKKWAEESVKNYAFNWSIVRPILVYGKPMTGKENLLTMVASALLKGESLKIFTDQTRMPTYVEDLAMALTTIIAKQSRGIFHICGADVLSPYQIAVAVARHLGYDEKRIEAVTAATFPQSAKRPPVTGFTIAKAATELCYTPASFNEGLKKTFGA